MKITTACCSSFPMMHVYILAEDFDLTINDCIIIRESTSSLRVSVVNSLYSAKQTSNEHQQNHYVLNTLLCINKTVPVILIGIQ